MILKKWKQVKKKIEIIKYFDRKYNKLELNENTFVKYHIIENAYKKKNNKKKFFIDSSQKIVILALNAFSDSPHYQGKLLFRDFYEWIEETLKFISKNNILNVTWLVKVHPAQFKTDRMSYDEITIVKKLIQKYKSNNIRMISDEISNPKLFSLATHCITCVSTIGLEFACHGKKPIICGDAIYNGLGFTNCILNKNKYFNTLKNLPNTNKLNTSEIHSAKSVIFLLDKIKQNELGIKNNLLPFRYNKSKAANDNEYIFDLYHKLKNNNQKITDNEYYKKVFNVTKHIFSKS